MHCEVGNLAGVRVLGQKYHKEACGLSVYLSNDEEVGMGEGTAEAVFRVLGVRRFPGRRVAPSKRERNFRGNPRALEGEISPSRVREVQAGEASEVTLGRRMNCDAHLASQVIE